MLSGRLSRPSFLQASRTSLPAEHPEFVVVRSLLPVASVPDMGIRLVGRWSTVTVSYVAAAASSDLKEAVRARRVSVLEAGRLSMRIWPLSKSVPLPDPSPEPDPPPASRAADPELLRVLKSIDSKLGDLLLRPSAPPAEVVAAHVAAHVAALSSSVAAGRPVPDGLPGAPHPSFIPSEIVPKDVKISTDIKVKTGSVDADVEGSTAALRKLRRG